MIANAPPVARRRERRFRTGEAPVQYGVGIAAFVVYLLHLVVAAGKIAWPN